MDAEDIDEHTDYYELFGVDEDCNPSKLKKSYYNLALKWHPDRNPNNIAEATRVFQVIEHAYSVLSDPHERAWYDGHRNYEVDELGHMSATKVDILSLFAANAYNGFGNGPKGFYSVFRNAFNNIALEEKAEAPFFGDENSLWNDVEIFYSYWTCFNTKRSFSFAEQYKLTEAPNAYYRREMSKENNKLKQKAEKEFVTAVRDLANYVRKRDPRVTKQIQIQEEIKNKKKIEDEKKKLEEKQKLLKSLEVNKVKIEYNEESLRYLHQFDEEEEKIWNCDYCKRETSNENAFKAHCATKKHKKATQNDRQDFLNDPTKFDHTPFIFLLLGLSSDEINRINPNIDMNLLISPKAKIIEEVKEIKNKKNKLEEEDEEEEENNNNNEDNNKNNKPLTKKEKRKLKILKEKERKEKLEKEGNNIITDKSNKKNKFVRNESIDSFSMPNITKKQKKLIEKEKNINKKDLKDIQHVGDEEEEELQQIESENKKLKKDDKKIDKNNQFICKKCKYSFTYKTKLFNNLKETVHEVFK